MLEMQVDSMAFEFPSMLKLLIYDSTLSEEKSEGCPVLNKEDTSYQECRYSFPCKRIITAKKNEHAGWIIPLVIIILFSLFYFLTLRSYFNFPCRPSCRMENTLTRQLDYCSSLTSQTSQRNESNPQFNQCFLSLVISDKSLSA